MRKLILILTILILITACQQKQELPNPAAVYCLEQGGTLEPRANPDGSQTTYCILPDKTACPQWEYYNQACPVPETPEPIEETPTLKLSELNQNPLDELDYYTIKRWGAYCKQETSDMDIADCILDWQENNIFFCDKDKDARTSDEVFVKGYEDCNLDMQFNEMIPGSFPVSKVFKLKARDNKLFGQYYTYATTFCVIARWHGLQCRVMKASSPDSTIYQGSGPGPCGIVPEDYINNLNLTCSQWKNLEWEMNTEHYWAEVLFNNRWTPQEKKAWAYDDNTESYLKPHYEYEDTEW